MSGYIGRTPLTNAQRRFKDHPTSAGQTNFLVPYTPGYIDVIVNGSVLNPSEYVATNGSSVVLNSPLSSSADQVVTIAWSAFDVVSLGIVPGTALVFYQPEAPLGWTQVTTHNDKALRIVSGVGGGLGGVHDLSAPPSTAHSHIVDAHVHGYNAVIAHTHGFTTTSNGNHRHSISGNSGSGSGGGPDLASDNAATVAYTNYDGTHNHSGNTDPTGAASANTGVASASGTDSVAPTAFSPKYIDVIICTKDD